jgi:hypothetical protein
VSKLYTMLDPLEMLGPLSASTGIPVGALVRYVLARWASAGSESLLIAGPSSIERVSAAFAEAEQTNTPKHAWRPSRLFDRCSPGSVHRSTRDVPRALTGMP